MMMVLGLYVFMLRTVPYQELQYQRSWRHAANSRVNRRPSTQFIGPDNDSLTLSGVLLPEVTGGRLSLLALEQMAELGKAWPLIEGSGTIYAVRGVTPVPGPFAPAVGTMLLRVSSTSTLIDVPFGSMKTSLYL